MFRWGIWLRRFILGSHFWSIAMKRAFVFLSLFASAAVGFAQQNKDPVTSVVKEILPHQEKNLVAAVEEMPADDSVTNPRRSR